jgi:hypothetical protein
LFALNLDGSRTEKYLRNVTLSSHVHYRGGDWRGRNGVDLRKSQSEKAIPSPTGEGGRELIGTFDGLVLNCNASDSNNILCTY